MMQCLSGEPFVRGPRPRARCAHACTRAVPPGPMSEAGGLVKEVVEVEVTSTTMHSEPKDCAVASADSVSIKEGKESEDDVPANLNFCQISDF